MKILRTPDDCFDNLPDYPFRPNYAEIPDLDGGTLRMHYVDEGPRDAPPVVMIHGNPSWSYLWRNIIPPVVSSGHRVIAIDLIGLGRSDKPTEMSDFTVARHVEWARSALIDVLNLTNITLILHDWGGIIGLRVLHQHPDRIARVALTNSGIFLRDPAEPPPENTEPSGTFADFQKMVRETPDWAHWDMVNEMCRKALPDDVVMAYHAPYPDARYLCGNRQFTQMLVTTHDNPQLADNWHAWQTIKQFSRPFVTIMSDGDQVTHGSEKRFIREVPGCIDQPHVLLPGGNHFLQEDIPEQLSQALIAWLKVTPSVI
jgi:haloalkane dehalogenase